MGVEGLHNSAHSVHYSHQVILDTHASRGVLEMEHHTCRVLPTTSTAYSMTTKATLRPNQKGDWLQNHYICEGVAPEPLDEGVWLQTNQMGRGVAPD